MDAQNSPMEFVIDSTELYDEISKKLLEKYPLKRIFAFYGEMGVGKTTFIKAICNSLNVADVVSSPTFAIVNVYNTSDLEELYHFDFYRLKSIEEAYDIGYEDYFYSGNYCFIEWPEMIQSLLPAEVVKVVLSVDSDNNQRIIRF